ncbi:MAG: Glutamyl-tRNA(Gln) synthetase (EC [uncultured Sulfurovum sp.]|uniref:Glutamyl-tRNA(Gln) synthetase (EC) n=1 Tax=uncultured Sulfurovum sp. TaxID=269237 RepID=A0A6S6SW44_9BACT|nr:MAG: Glutamyl-tRNA(Gln) synthetase (EC [uncultured Sulfurovum sp.]
MLRFAPSPTGDMHIGNLRVAILNYLVSQQKNDQFLIRMEDTNTQRIIEGKDTEIMMLLEKFALKHDSVFHQSEHLNLYQILALRLLKEKKAFICTCKNEELEETQPYSGHCENLNTEDYDQLKASGEKFVIRIKKPEDNNEIDSFIIVNTDGLPTYNFACAADDMMSNIDFIIRDEKYLDDTPKQMYIKNLLGYENETQYFHLPSIIDKDEISVKWLFQEGFIPDAILNYLILLGNTEAPKEVFTLPEAIEWFDLNSILKSTAKFDMAKLRFINREHLKLMDDKQLSTLFSFADADIGKLAKLYLEECSTVNELKERITSIFTPKDFDTEWGEEMQLISDIIFQAPEYKSFDELTQHIINESGLKNEKLINPLRRLLTGTGTGPELSEIYPLIKSYLLEVAS